VGSNQYCAARADPQMQLIARGQVFRGISWHPKYKLLLIVKADSQIAMETPEEHANHRDPKVRGSVRWL